MSQDPQTPEEWQAAVDAAHASLALDSCRQYGLITGGPVVDIERCQQILQRGAEQGYQPAPDALERLAGELLDPVDSLQHTFLLMAGQLEGVARERKGSQRARALGGAVAWREAARRLREAQAKTLARSKQTTRQRINELARRFYAMTGNRVPESHRFDQAQHPAEVLCWDQAVAAYEFFTGNHAEDVMAEEEEV